MSLCEDNGQWDLVLPPIPTDVSDDLESDAEDFEDAIDAVKMTSDMDLDAALADVGTALHLFLNNYYEEASKRLLPLADSSIYHALGYGTILYIHAALTFEEKDISTAVATIKKSLNVCNKQRKKQGLVNFSNKNYSNYTDVEIHAELCYAELLILRAFLTFISDESLVSFVKGGLKIRACYHSYKECMKILQKRTWKDDSSKPNFESGVHLGIGLFNLMISLLPTKVLKLLEFVGFSGKKDVGLQELVAGAKMQTCLRGPLCTLSLLAYHTVMTYVLGNADGDTDLCDELIEPCLEKYPKGAMFLFFAGRLEEIKGNIENAIAKLEQCIEVQNEWKQFHHLCYWELMWCHSFQGEWLFAMKYAEKLCQESRWSRSTYAYQKAAFLIMCNETGEEVNEHIYYLMKEVPKYQMRLAGKSIPIEKFAIKKAKKYAETKCLTLPGLELVYVWNGFSIIGKTKERLSVILQTVEETTKSILDRSGDSKYYFDDYCLCLLLKGVCLKHLGQDFQAEQCFREIWLHEKKLELDTYLVPYALSELLLLFIQSNNLEEANIIFNKCKRYKGYTLESRLHFRLHDLGLKLRNLSGTNGDSDSVEAMETPPSTPKSEVSPSPPPSPT